MAAQGAAAGFVVISGRFISDATVFASGPNTQLIEGHELHEMIRDVLASSDKTPFGNGRSPSSSTNEPSGCLVYGSPMVRREAKRGARAGTAFY